jgi:hypothetical protein
MQVGRSAFTTWALKDVSPANHRNFQRITVWFVVSAVLWIVGGLAAGEMRLGLWAGAIAFVLSTSIPEAFEGRGLEAAEIRDNPDSEWAPNRHHTSPGWDITIKGEISPGDDVAFAALLDQVKRNHPDAWPMTVWLNSPGGDVETSEHIADLISHFNLWTHVADLCASSCFMLLCHFTTTSISYRQVRAQRAL